MHNQWKCPTGVTKVGVKVVARNRAMRHDEDFELIYKNVSKIGEGTFGTVYSITSCENEEILAVKKTISSNKNVNELLLLRELEHPNIIDLKYYYFKTGTNSIPRIHLVTDYLPKTLQSISQEAIKRMERPVPPLELKVYGFQIFRALAYMHERQICHRDLEDRNILVNQKTCLLKLCDFGHAVKFTYDDVQKKYKTVSIKDVREYVDSGLKYSIEKDIRNAGRNLAKLFTSEPYVDWKPDETPDYWFDGLEPLLRILNNLPMKMRTKIGNKVVSKKRMEKFTAQAEREEIKFFAKVMMETSDEYCMPATECLADKYFDEIRVEGLRFENGGRLPPLFNFADAELRELKKKIRDKIIPSWCSPSEDDGDKKESPNEQ